MVMAEQRGSSFSHTLGLRESIVPNQAPDGIDLGVKAPNVSTVQRPYQSQGHRRRKTYQAVIENPLARLTDEELEQDVREFQRAFLPSVTVEQLLRAVHVARDIRIYDMVARSSDPDADRDLPIRLTAKEKIALKKEKDSLPSEPTMLIVILTVSLAAFLQGFVQSSINGASLYPEQFNLNDVSTAADHSHNNITGDDWRLGFANGSPFLFAALVGCWLALPINEHVGRRGAMATAACLIFASSIGAAFCDKWEVLFGIRIFNGIGMGLKAVSTPILASETAVRYWRGTSILAWQLWVAFGIATGFAFNLIFYGARRNNRSLVVSLILGAPLVPAIFLLASLYFCPESPRYYMRQWSSHFNPEKAYGILLKLRGEELQALRDIYLIYKSVQQEETSTKSQVDGIRDHSKPQGLATYISSYTTQYKHLFTRRRLRNALVSSSIVALAQQLCGINVFAFYSGPLFSALLPNNNDPLRPMLYSFGYGAVNFLFGLLAIRTIDTLGRRKWLVLTLPIMCLLMTAAALSTLIQGGDEGQENDARDGVIALFVFLFAAAYSPGMGPIPFTLASESFPLSHREVGCAFAIATNLLFAGLLSVLFPSIYARLGDGGTFALFAGLNLVAFALVFLLVEETKLRSLEDLDAIFAVSKRRFMRHQVSEYLPWFFRRYVLGRAVPRPELYLDLIWGNQGDGVAGALGDVAGHIPVSPPPLPIRFSEGGKPAGAVDDDDHW
ncbi:sugar transporter-domain-containing protein [Xylaria nigripes]|nr:sugar transporter-domain-containing protein [Xylaria nigripes]